jgi:hypothetical protein
VAEIRGLAAGQPAFSLRADTAFGGDLEAILATAEDESKLDAGVPGTPAERALVEEVLAKYPASLLEPARFAKGAFAAKRVVRLNAGVSSFPLRRFRVVVEGPGPGAGDDCVLELKETRGRSAAAIVALQRQFQELPDDDELLGWASSREGEFRVRRVSAEQRRLSIERIVKQVKSPRWGKKDLREVATQSGRLLARGHARASDATGKPGLGAIAPAVGDGRGLAYETVGYAGRAAALAESDLDQLRALLKQYGPLLGWQRQ